MPEQQADDRRTRILDAAESLFAEHGFDATPTARVAAQAGVPKGLVFYYFPTKPDLLTALLEERLPDHPLCDAHEVARPGEPVASLVRLAAYLQLGSHESTVLRTILFREAGTHPEVRARLRALRSGLLALTERVLALSAGELDPEVRRHAAHTYVACLLDEASARRYDGELPDLEAAARIVCAALPAGEHRPGPVR